jgi:putative membrane protein
VSVRTRPIDRPLRLANLTGHTVLGPVSGGLGGVIDRDAALAVWERTAEAVVAASAADRSHRWSERDAEKIEGRTDEHGREESS